MTNPLPLIPAKVAVSYEQWREWRENVPETDNWSVADSVIVFHQPLHILTGFFYMWKFNIPEPFAMTMGYAAVTEAREFGLENLKPRAVTCPECGAICFLSSHYEVGHKDGCPMGGYE